MRKSLGKQYKEELYKIAEQSFSELDKNYAFRMAKLIVRIEVLFYFVSRVFPQHKDIDSVHKLFFSNILPSFNELSELDMKALVIIQSLLTSFSQKRYLNRSIKQYMNIDGNLRYVSFNLKENSFKWKNCHVDRRELYEKILKSSLDLDEYKLNSKIPEELWFYEDKKRFSIDIDSNLVDKDYIHKSVCYEDIQDIEIDLDDLVIAARKMDMKLYRNWEGRIRNIVFNYIVNNDFKETKKLKISGLEHWVGKLSVGKSTIMYVIAYYIAVELKKRVTLVLSSISDVSEAIDNFESMDIKAVPLTSYNYRREHIRKVYNRYNIDNKNPLSIYNNHSFKYLSDTCHVYNSNHSIIRTKANGMPCRSINNGECPYSHKCDSLKVFEDLDSAQVIVTTIHSVVKSRVPKSHYLHNARILEYIYRKSDLVFIDESDYVQTELDNIFCSSIELIGGDFQINKLSGYVNEIEMDNPWILGNKEYNEWRKNLLTCKIASGDIYTMLYDNIGKVKQKFLKSTFTADKLISDICSYATGYIFKIKDSTEEKEMVNEIKKQYFDILQKTFSDFHATIKGNAVYEEVDLYARELVDIAISNEPFANDLIKDRVNSLITRLANDLDVKLVVRVSVLSDWTVFMMAVIRLERSLRLIRDELSSISETLNKVNESRAKTNILNSDLVKANTSDFDGVLPLTPIGGRYGFKFDDSHNILRILNIDKIGRYILTSFSKLYEKLDNKRGANCILLSGTSYAPYSTKFNLHIPVKCLLQRKDDKNPQINYYVIHPKIAVSEGFKPIFVSGKYDINRIKEIEKMIKYLSKKSKRLGKSLLDKAIDLCEPKRERLLIIVGSYEEADIVKNFILKYAEFSENEIFALSRSEAEDDVENSYWLREKISKFAESNGKILIAPLKSVDRGHNILNDEQVAAFGTLIYLVRPYPLPFDIGELTSTLNSYALDYYMNENNKSSFSNEVNDVLKTANKIYNDFFRPNNYYERLEPRERANLLANLYCITWQVEGRLIRGDVGANVIFADGKFYPNTAKGGVDTSKTSIIEGWKELWDYELESNNIESKILNALYSTRVEGLKNIKELT